MKRREFIRSSLSAGAALTPSLKGSVGAATKISTHRKSGDKFLLPISRSGLPVEGWNHWAKVAELVEGLVSDPTLADSFNRNPGQHLIDAGLDASAGTMSDQHIGLLVAATSPTFREAARTGDYASLFAHLEAAGIFSTTRRDELSAQLDRILEEIGAEVRSALEIPPDGTIPLATATRFVGSSKGPASSVDAAVLQQIMDRSGRSAFVVTIAAAAVIAAVYVAVALFATVGVAQYRHLSTDQSPYPIIYSGAPRLSLIQLSALDPDLSRSLELASKLGSLMGDHEIRPAIEDMAVRQNVEEVFLAMRRLGIVSFENSELSGLVTATITYSDRVLDIPT